MKITGRLWRCLAAYLVVLICLDWEQMQSVVHAQNIPDIKPACINLIAIMDNSGSMKTSDPTGLRFTGVEMTAGMMNALDQLSVIAFSTNSHLLTEGWISPGAFLEMPIEQPGGYTDMLLAMVWARQLVISADPNCQAQLLLLSDGKPEIPNQYPEYEQQILDLARSLDVPIHAIALTPSADLEFLQRMAVNTGGFVFVADDAGDLVDAFLQAFGTIQDRTVVNGQSAPDGRITFSIDPSLAPYADEVSFAVGKPPGMPVSLLDPFGRRITEVISGVAIREDERYFIATIRQPAGGDWTVIAGRSGQASAYAILYSRLRIALLAPTQIQSLGTPIPIVLQLVDEQPDGQKATILGDVAFTALVTSPDGSQSSLDVFYDDGTHGDQIAGDGAFTRLLPAPAQPGTYNVQVFARKGAIPVERTFRFDAAQFPKLVIDAPQGKYDIQTEPLNLVARLEGGEATGLDRGQVIARVTAPSGAVVEVVLQGEQGVFAGEYHPAENGLHQAQFEVRDGLYLGAPFEASGQSAFEVRLTRFVEMGTPQVQVEAGCLDRSVQVMIRLPVRSLRQEALTVSLEGLAGWVLQPREMLLDPGSGVIELRAYSESAGLLPGEDQRANLVIEVDPETQLRPGAFLAFTYSIPSPWQRCQGLAMQGGAVGLGAVIMFAVVFQRIRAARSPVVVTGSLRWWLGDSSPAEYRECDLTALARPALTVGAQSDCDVVISEGQLDDRHAMLVVDGSQGSAGVFLQPVSAVKRGYSLVRTRFPLAHGDIFEMGGLNFQYLSDSGE